MRKLVYGALLGGISSASVALPPTPAPQIELYISGSSAQDEALENLIRLSGSVPGTPALCETGTLDIYRGNISGTANRVYYCRTTRKAARIAPGQRLAICKSSGGSGDGVTPVSAATPLHFIDLGKLPQTPSCVTGRAERAAGDFAAYTNHTACDGEGKLAVPRAGLSDVNPELVGGCSTPTSDAGPT
jgi:hypothetical protein